MKNKNITNRLLQLIISGFIAFIIMTTFCFFYYNPGIHLPSDNGGATDYIWCPNSFLSRATEGFAYHFIDQNGHNNVYDIPENGIDVLVLGSSHTEGFNVGQNENYTSLLNEEYQDTMFFYNIGTSGHTFIRCIKNLENAIEWYKPSKYIILETSTLEFDKNEINSMLSGKMATLPSYNEGIIYYMQKSPFLKLLHSQLGSVMRNQEDNQNILNTSIDTDGTETGRMLDYLNDVLDGKNIEIIICFHPILQIGEDGEISAVYNNEIEKSFMNECKKRNFTYINMSDRFIREYKENYILPYGFSNSAVGRGHLNKNGHRFVASELAKIIDMGEML